MNQHQLLAELFRRGVKLWATGDQLHVRAPKGALTPELRDCLAVKKMEILSAVSSMNVATRVPPVPLVTISRKGNLPLSFNQQRLWSLAQIHADSPVYNLCKALRLTGPLNVPALEQSIREIVRRHEILRSRFPVVEGQSVQIISSGIPVQLPVVDLRELPSSEMQVRVQRLASVESRQSFNLAQGPLLRVKLLQLGNEEHLFFLTVHHIVFDGWSFNVFWREIATLYAAFSSGEPSTLRALPIQYADFAHWEQQMLQHEALKDQLDYWKQQLGGNVPALELPLDRPRPQGQTSQGARQSLVLPEKLTDALKALGQREESTLFMVLLAAFQTLLHGYTGQEDIIVCSPVSGRHRPETKELIGYFSRLLPMRTGFSGNPSFREGLGRVRRVVSEAYEHQDVPLQMLADFPNLVRTPLSRGMFLLQISGRLPAPPGLSASLVEVHNGVSDFDLSLSMEETAATLTGVLEYKTDLFDATTISQMIRDFQTLLEEIVVNPDRRIAQTERRAPLVPDPIKPGANRPFVAARNELELQLTEIWEKIFRTKPIGVKDNFFELGGHSLLAVQLFAQIEKHFGKKLLLATLLQAPTVAQLASLLGPEGHIPPWSSLVALQPRGSKPPFFCIHAVGGEVLFYHDLACLLGLDQPVYGLQAQGLDGAIKPHTTIEEAAAHYIQLIRTIQPEGPYFLCGGCLGGVVVFEMAQQLYAQGQKTALLVMLNSVAPYSRKSLRHWMYYGMQVLLHHPVALARYMYRNRLPRWLKRAKAIGARIFGHSQYQHQESPPAVGYVNVGYVLLQSYRHYKPRIYPGRITHFVNSERASLPLDLWGEFAANGVDLHIIPGNRLEMLTLHVRELAEKLRPCLDEAQTDTR